MIVGFCHSEFPTTDVACVWDGGAVSVMGTGQTGSGGLLQEATSVNESGQAVGISLLGPCNHAFFWDGDPSHDALDLPELSDTREILAFALNDLGQGAGAASLWTGEESAVFWDTDHSVRRVPGMSGLISTARDVNNAGWVVGSNDFGAWVWDGTGTAMQLQDLLVGPNAELADLTTCIGGATGIDEYGRIAAAGMYDGQATALLLTPVSYLVDALIEDVEALVNQGLLGRGQGKALIVKLEQALARLDDGHVKSAVNALGAFVNQVAAFVRAGILAPEDGQELSDQANDLIDLFTTSAD
jgi:uncharacterized membrane protein